MTETDATRKPLDMPAKFIPYLQKYRIYQALKAMLADLVIALPRDHLKHMKVFLSRHLHSSKDTDSIMLLVSPELDIDVKKLVKELIKDLGYFVITRRCVMDRYEKDDDYEPGCISPVLMSKVTKMLTQKDPVVTAGWLMFVRDDIPCKMLKNVASLMSRVRGGANSILRVIDDTCDCPIQNQWTGILVGSLIFKSDPADHPCTLREARCLQADGVLPTVTLVLKPPPPTAPPAPNTHTPMRSFFDQDFEGLCFAYKATVKEIHVEPQDDIDKISVKCFNGIRACVAGAQGPGQGYHVTGAPGVYRVLLIGPRGSGRKTQARMLAQHFGLVYVDFWALYKEAKERNDEAGGKLRSYGPSVQLKADIVRRRILQKDCIDNGWVMVGYPTSGVDFENLDNTTTPPNRVIFLNVEWTTCKERAMAVAVDWCTGKRVTAGSGPRTVSHPGENEAQIDYDLDYFFSEALAELRAAAGITAVEISAEQDSVEDIQVKIQAAVIAAPAFDIVSCAQLRNVKGD